MGRKDEELEHGDHNPQTKEKEKGMKLTITNNLAAGGSIFNASTTVNGQYLCGVSEESYAAARAELLRTVQTFLLHPIRIPEPETVEISAFHDPDRGGEAA